MANLDTQLKSVKFNSVPGRENQQFAVWLLTMLSSSDTLTIPALLTRSGSADQSSARVLSPATGVTVTAAAVTSDNEHVLTIAGASAGDTVILVTLHPRGNRGTVAKQV